MHQGDRMKRAAGVPAALVCLASVAGAHKCEAMEERYAFCFSFLAALMPDRSASALHM